MFPEETPEQSTEPQEEQPGVDSTAVAELAEPDTLTQIEERILRAVELVTSLRQERDAAVRETNELREEQRNSEAAGRSMGEEIVSLKAERKQVRSRLERLLGHIDQVN